MPKNLADHRKESACVSLTAVQNSLPVDLGSDRGLYEWNHSKNVITTRNPECVEYQAESTAH